MCCATVVQGSLGGDCMVVRVHLNKSNFIFMNEVASGDSFSAATLGLALYLLA
jgi:hypothetical protein